MLLRPHHSLAQPHVGTHKQAPSAFVLCSSHHSHNSSSSSKRGGKHMHHHYQQQQHKRVRLVCAAAGDSGAPQDDDTKQPQQPPQQQQQPQQPPQQQQPQPGQRIQLTPALAAKLVAAAAAAGRPASSLTPQDAAVITAAWLPLLPATMGECNKLLSGRMRAALPGDPLGFDLIKQDGKDFMTGVIPASEFADRFYSIFSSTPGSIRHELFLQMALLVPQPAKRLELLQHAANPWVLPSGPVTADSITAALTQAQAEAAPAAAAAGAASEQRTTTTAAAAAEGADSDSDEEDLMEEEDAEWDEDEEKDEDEFENEFEDEFEELDEGEEEEGEEDEAAAGGDEGGGSGSGRSGGDRPPPSAADLMASADLRELKGWTVLDRSRLQALSAGLSVPSSEELAAAAAAKRPASKKQVLAGVGLDTGIHTNSAGSRPAKKSAGKKSKAGGTAAAAASGDPSTLSSSNTNALMWFRQDLRIHDNPALVDAAKWAQRRGGSVVCVYVHSPEKDGDAVGAGSSWRPGAASLLWVECALQSLSSDLVLRYGAGAAIVFKQGPYLQALTEVAGAVGAGAVFYNSRYEPAMRHTDAAVASQLSAAGLSVHAHAALLLQEPWNVKLNLSKWNGGHFGTLTPFYRSWSTIKAPERPLPEPQQLPVAKSSAAPKAGGVPLSDLRLYRPPRRRQRTAAAAAAGGAAAGDEQAQPPALPSPPQQQPDSRGTSDVVDWGSTIRSTWDISERGALQLLNTFLSSATGLSAYEMARSFADGRSVSRLSPYLHFGQLSARLMWQRMKVAKAQDVSKTFYRRLVWRDLAYWQLYHWPHMATVPIRPGYERMQWATGPEAEAQLRAWQQGQTGFPLVDAGMRELWATGWMQQSVRMVAAAFLTEYLNLPWTAGAAWFHDCLVDADLAINSMMWQNAGKSGLDQWNFTLLPTSRSQDPTGAYIKRWVPELSQLPPAHVHTPWTAPAAELEAAGVVLGQTYPYRIVTADLSELRAANIRAARTARAAAISAGSLATDDRGYDMVEVPQGSSLKHDGSQVVVFTKQEYRQLSGPIPAALPTAAGAAPVDEGEAADEEDGDGGSSRRWGAKQKAPKRQRVASGGAGGGGGGKGQRRPQRGAKGKQQGQRTLDEFVSSIGQGR